MSRRRQTPWIQLWSRPIIGAIAILGSINTAYLTITKLSGNEAVCPTSGCEQVLSSSYAEMFGLPLALFGLLAYLAMAVLALGPLLVNPDTQKKLRTDLENTTWFLLFLGATAMLVFSAYLMYIMFTEFVAPYGVAGLCYYCLASATFATAMFVVTILGKSWDDVGQLLFTGVLVSVMVLVSTVGIYSANNAPSAPAGQPGSSAPAGQPGPPVTTLSGNSEMQLASHLASANARMFGAYWCPHCHDQKQLFGQQAFSLITYVECAPDGAYSQADLCKSISELQGYPSWEINGKYYAGQQSLERLADISRYSGPRNFQNNLRGLAP